VSLVGRRSGMMPGMRYLFVGDSMTVGAAGDYTWRYRIWRHLSEAGERCTVVGPRDALYDPAAAEAVSDDYADPAFPGPARRHLAGWGEGWLHMVPLIGDAVREHRPDVLLVSLGLIDLGFYTNAEQTAANAARFMAEARAAGAGVRMVLLPVIPNTRADIDPYFARQCAELNERIAKVVAELDSPDSPLLLASRPRDYDIRRDTYDGTHPNAAGEHKLAAAFADALHQAWGIGARYSAA
jgi:GDSL-like lipase/acylhydrolase family protein